MIEKDFEIVKKLMEKNNAEMKYELKSENMIGSMRNESLDITSFSAEQVKMNREKNTLIYCKRIFRFLQLLCEGHNRYIQNWLRVQLEDQNFAIKNVNFLTLSTLKFKQTIKFLNKDCAELTEQILDFLIEAIQGPCLKNQVFLAEISIVEFIKDLLSSFQKEGDYKRRNSAKFEDKEKINSVISKSIILLLSMMEGNHNIDIIKYINNQLNFQHLVNRVKQIFYDYVEKKLNLPRNASLVEINLKIGNKRKWEDSILHGFNKYILLSTIANSNLLSCEENNAIKFLYNDGNNENNIWQEFFEENTASIEIFFNNSLNKIFFPIHPACKNLTDSTKERIMDKEEKINRDSANEKIQSLMDLIPSLFDEMEHFVYLKTLCFHFTRNRLNTFRDFSTFLAFVMNLIIVWYLERLFTFNEKNKSISSYIHEQRSPYQIILYWLQILQLITSFFFLLFYLVIDAPLINISKWRILVDKNKKLFDPILEKYLEKKKCIDPSLYSGKECEYILLTKGPNSSYFMRKDKRNLGPLYSYILYYSISLKFLLTENSFLFILFYILISILGQFKSILFYSFHLLDIMNRFVTLKNVIKSVTKNAFQLFLTVFLGLIIIYLYTLVGFFYLSDSYFQTNMKENICTSIAQCFSTIIYWGLRYSGGIGSIMYQEPYHQKSRFKYYFRFFYDLSFYLFINVTLINIILELRDTRTKTEFDRKNVCFICHLNRSNFDRTSNGFEFHIKRDHNLWNYIYYIYYLNSKDSTELFGIETYVADLIKNKDNSWFPIMKAICLKTFNESEEKEDLMQTITELGKHVNIIETYFQDK